MRKFSIFNFSAKGGSASGGQFSSNENGQVMLLTVLVLSAVFLSATVIAGLLTVYQINQVTRIADSARAIYAADTAIERGLFRVFRCNPDATTGNLNPIVPSGSWRLDAICVAIANQQSGSSGLPRFLNDAEYSLIIESTNRGPGVHDPNTNNLNFLGLSAVGRAGKSARAFEIGF